MPSELPTRVHIVEVGPRDGLQNEPEQIPTQGKIEFIQKLCAAGLPTVEATSFVHPKAIPQLADSGDVMSQLADVGDTEIMALVPNARGLERAIAADLKRIAVFTAASDAFTQKNINMSVAKSLDVFSDVVAGALAGGMSVRGYVSTAFVCPYAGEIDKSRVRDVCEKLIAMGCDEVAVSDTIGAAVPKDILGTVGHVLESIPLDKVALHLHDTFGTALANVYAGLQLGVARFDASAGGLGGCPYAKGASGNLATEDLVYFLDRMGIETGVNLERVFEASSGIAKVLNRVLPSKQWQRMRAIVPK
ncbi:MAG: hydroxymethylglutaryl-CoA lyase [Phycisphaerales bacterium]|nr:hydroxymethylglutaryl-CoA lyase [Phycisphaerales bacterium]MCB9856346.1 hydroxymethylglutaryl-CoA lyase [Phycisphaerales bacterium]MCB9864018.1 hydroxymethylglutaryl-CoA lyase [Phycisphaerales bacterium]